ncbi:alpha-D-xyloside xylohydrolase [Arachidicoccus rhizosphaerae]|uniref:Alpha-D-xyloside xylohydrolase n=1 Tax=Arachidicoccus rhizosphaerae TaxID=551991 RepID=A0A1H3VH45_9BACT|nr:TIM-barrel domain-containing protein [Arachidicoccus rhizosphaerae]SDZ73442.1 alpha-D-xyloside xylohydrolase [Arachidicoccus rhizosphaerae]
MRGNLSLKKKKNGKLTWKTALGLMAMATFSYCSGQVTAQNLHPTYTKIQNGIILPIHQANNGAQFLKLQFVSPDILHVMAKPDTNFALHNSIMTLSQPLKPVEFQISHQKGGRLLLLKSTQLQATVDLVTGQIRYLDKDGKTLLEETSKDARSLDPVAIGEPGYYSVVQQFNNLQNAPLYGLGGNQLGYTDMRGKDLEMIQYNSNVFNPLLVSTGHFGIFWNNTSITYYGHPEQFRFLESLQLFDKNGKAGGLTATYISDSSRPRESFSRRESSIGYQFAKDTAALPEAFVMNTKSKVIWEGQISSSEPKAVHDFILKFGGYIKVWLDNKQVADWWRQAWNPAEVPFQLEMEPDKKYNIKVVWSPDGAASFAAIRQKKAAHDTDRQIRFHSEAGKQIDYFVLTGQNIDSLISGYRLLTGRAPLMPKWAYGFWQSKEHYNSQQEILETAAEFRKRQIPIDNIVQDWYYWKKDDWGSQRFDADRYPDPAKMISELHQTYNLHFMISVWPKFYQGSRYFKTFWDHNWLYKQNVNENRQDWMGYVSTFYDAFNPEAGKAFWDIVRDNIYSKGVDAWWLDATEPDIVDNITNERRMELMTPTYSGAPQINFNAFALAQDKTFYTEQRKADPNKRVFILTRSATGGAQHYAASTWSGDIGATWQEMHRQIATGISFSMTGIPYWSMDIGGFAVESKYQHLTPALKAAWQELQTRWFQFGTFSPIFRSHGQAPAREMFHTASKGEPAYQSMRYYDQLRYRLMPYIYSLGAATYFKDYTLMRGLAMDFSYDPTATEISDAFMFGPALLIEPVTTAGATTKKVYLPKPEKGAGNWYCLYDGKSFKGGQSITAEAPYERMPVFVPAGTILPLGPVTQHTTPLSDSLDLYIYQGSDGHFTLYQDQGTTYDYEKGDFQKIAMHYEDQSGRLLIDSATGSYTGPGSGPKTFLIHLVSPQNPVGIDSKSPATKVVRYQGQALELQLR